MLAEMERIQVALHDMLSQSDVKKVNISKLCIEAKISRKTFYLRYGKINNCIEACILSELRKLRKEKGNSLKQLLHNLCGYIQKHKQYFYNAYHLSEKDCMCEKMRGHFFQYIRSYAHKRGSFSELIVKQLANILYDRICFWISHECNEDFSCLLEDLVIIIELIDFQNQLCSSQHQVFDFSHYYLKFD
ncbi:hypothetical protein FD18_GL001283 [Lactobacillus taiwanensis DSM 21401]|jgi:hypothetical protein|uniref:Transcriptional regulator n=1 Tax=Lactobacillus taiwanensis TaxID=508451 RepID=A0A256LG11_9LACO|nr:hypothetical protein [Lactobacillus taiwanensis]KRM98318.1 hypothetical protein FD18_GL001283 [Lactobacillus taiwanensis DSM 21401]OYR88374.1 transcriptional regulator [Lactobacillus taiwanensis]OYR89571.1 transcriptional regulator [Lactobacillus taiwanensis]OYR92270.1 transcriptional regulator [Lactobacillus taiwanensis]OYR95662.1 transcriptional regulator [Lactobacillus taiwanensis]